TPAPDPAAPLAAATDGAPTDPASANASLAVLSDAAAVYAWAQPPRSSASSVSRSSARFGSKQRQRAAAVSLLVNGVTSTGQSPGSAMRPRVGGTSFHASIMACSVAASSVGGRGERWCSRSLSCAASVEPPETGGALLC